MITTTLSDFRKEMKLYLDRITNEMETIIINRGKDKGVVLLSSKEYNEYLRLKEESTRLSAAEIASINRGLDAAKQGKTTPHTEVMKKFNKYVSDKLD